MTDYELLDLFIQNADSLQSAFMNYIAVLFAFLIAGYLAAATLVFVVVALFTLVTLQQALYTWGYGNDLAGFAGQIIARAAENPSALGWHGTASLMGVAISNPVASSSGSVVIILSYIGALVLFFHQRHVGRAQQHRRTHYEHDRRSNLGAVNQRRCGGLVWTSWAGLLPGSNPSTLSWRYRPGRVGPNIRIYLS